MERRNTRYLHLSKPCVVHSLMDFFRLIARYVKTFIANKFCFLTITAYYKNVPLKSLIKEGNLDLSAVLGEATKFPTTLFLIVCNFSQALLLFCFISSRYSRFQPSGGPANSVERIL